MRRLRTHDPPGYLLALAGVVALIGGVLMSYEGTRFGEHADPWHHFWFCCGVGLVGCAVALAVVSVVLFVKEHRRRGNGEQELVGRRSALTPAPKLVEEVEVKRWFRVEIKRRYQ